MSEQKTTSEHYATFSKAKYQLEEAQLQLKKVKDDYCEAMVQETIQHLMTIQKEEKEPLKERDYEIFLRDLARKVAQLYER